MYELTQDQWNKVQNRIALISRDQNEKWWNLNYPNGRKRKGKEIKVYPTEFLIILQKLLGGLTYDKETAYFIILNLDNEDYVVGSLLDTINK